MSHSIHIKDLELYGYHGVLSDEKSNGQVFLLSLDVKILSPSSDNIEETLDYRTLLGEIERVFFKKSYDLLEVLNQDICHHLLAMFQSIQSITLSMQKPNVILSQKLSSLSVSYSTKRSIAYLSLGTNLGDRENNLMTAYKFLSESNTIKLLKQSSFYDTTPFEVTEKQNNYLNSVIEINTFLTPHELLHHINEIEEKMGRLRTHKNASRIIDIDILSYGQEIIHCETLNIPHLESYKRMFVLLPWSEIAPHYFHPTHKKTIVEMKTNLEKQC